MTAPNHALTGALIGLSIHNPLAAAPLAFLSHFACDAIPHYDSPDDKGEGHASKRFIGEQLIAGAVLCFLLVVVLALTHPKDWFLAAVCAFLAASPDLFWFPKFLHEVRTGTDKPPQLWLLRFHAWIQWKTSPKLWWTEALWTIGCLAILILKIR